MTKKLKLTLTKRQVSATAELLETAAPNICKLVWDALPIENPVFHVKRSNNEVFALYKPFSDTQPELEHATIFPIPGDLAYFHLPPYKVTNYVTALKKYLPDGLTETAQETGLADIGLFYGRNSFLFGPLGPGPGSVFARIIEGLDEMAAACNDIWYAGAVEEKLRIERG